uniref:Uncharacterized protein n=1 Tax=Anguilla anguilla TaxID=7936 RepID=A0A0E9UKK2_ANGAN
MLALCPMTQAVYELALGPFFLPKRGHHIDKTPIILDTTLSTPCLLLLLLLSVHLWSLSSYFSSTS